MWALGLIVDPLDDVLHFIERSTHSHFPVVEDDSTLAGVIHFSDVRDVIYDPAMRDLVTAIDLANPDFTVVTPDTPLRDLLEAFAALPEGFQNGCVLL